MDIINIIEKKRDHNILNEEEINFFVFAYVKDTIKDYQMSALLMAIYLNGLNKDELFFLTKAMIESGTSLDLSMIEGTTVDKHSTGGVGDKTTLVLGPMLAACGLNFAKMSGRGLSHTGGTIDKLESIAGFQVELSKEDFIRQVNEIHIAIIGQSESLVIADKKIYALRDVSGTVASIPLIASSIMAKKIAAGCDFILLDVKYGDGAFMKTKEEAKQLGCLMIEIGEAFNKKVKVAITNMQQPLGYAIGNTVEIMEAVQTLQGNGPQDLLSLCIQLGAIVLVETSHCKTIELGRKRMRETIENRSAFGKLIAMVEHQHGDSNFLFHLDTFKTANDKIPIYAKKEGFIARIECNQLGTLACALGAGRRFKDDIIHHEVGIVLNKKQGEYVKQNDILCWIHANEKVDNLFLDTVRNCFMITENKLDANPLIEEIL